MKALKEKILDCGIKLSWVAMQLGITREALYKKLNGVTEFKASEIGFLIDLLKLTPEEQTAYFFTFKRD